MPQNWRAYLLLTFTALCWGGNAVFGRMAVGQISPMALVSLRWLGVVILLAAFAHRYVRRDWAVLKNHLLFVSVMGALGLAVFNALFYVAAHTTTALNIGIIQGSIPVFVLVGVFLVYQIPVTKLQAVGVLLTICGVILVGSGGEFARIMALEVAPGDVLMVVACVLYAGYAIGLLRRPAASALGTFTAIAGAAFLASVPLSIAEVALGQFQWPTATGWIIVALVTLFPSLLAQVCFIHGVELIGPSRAGVFVNLVPVFAAVLAVTFLGEPFERFHAIALFLVLGGIWLSERSRGQYTF